MSSYKKHENSKNKNRNYLITLGIIVIIFRLLTKMNRDGKVNRIICKYYLIIKSPFLVF